MNAARYIIAGLIGGVIGAAAWALIAWFTGWELGLLAWGIGGLVGVCVRKAAAEETGVPPALAAMLIAVLSVLAGKYTAHSMMFHQHYSPQALAAVSYDPVADEEFLISELADEIIEAEEAAGRTIEMPATADFDNDTYIDDYPPEIWRRAKKQWDDLDPQGRAEYAQARADELRRIIQSSGGMFSSGSLALHTFKYSFGLWDLLWFGLAAFTAWKLGYGEE